MRSVFEVSNSVNQLHAAIAYSLPEKPDFSVKNTAVHLNAQLRSQAEDSKKLVVKSLPPLGAQIVAAIAQVRERSLTVNFAMVYDEYRENHRTAGFNGGSAQLQRKSVAKKVGHIFESAPHVRGPC